jgi:hypothetical protein
MCLDKQREVNRRLDRITLMGLGKLVNSYTKDNIKLDLGADFVAGLNLLPHKFLWAGKLNQRTSATFFLIASIVGLYKLF